MLVIFVIIYNVITGFYLKFEMYQGKNIPVIELYKRHMSFDDMLTWSSGRKEGKLQA